MTLYSRSTRLMPQMAPRASHLMFGALLDAGIKLQLGRAVDKIDAGMIRFGDNTSDAFDACFLVSAVRPPRWLSTTGLALDDNGFIAVHPTLQSKAMPIYLPQVILPQLAVARGQELVSLRFAQGLFWPKTFANICMVTR